MMIYERVGAWIVDAEKRDEYGGTGKETARIIGAEVIDYVREIEQSFHCQIQEARQEGKERERKKIKHIVQTWLETSNPAHAQELFDALDHSELDQDNK